MTFKKSLSHSLPDLGPAKLLLLARYVYTSSFRRPPGVGAELEKGAPPPFDPPDLVPRFARPNPELASLTPLSKKPIFALSGNVVNFVTRKCLLLVLLRGATRHYAFRQAEP